MMEKVTKSHRNRRDELRRVEKERREAVRARVIHQEPLALVGLAGRVELGLRDPRVGAGTGRALAVAFDEGFESAAAGCVVPLLAARKLHIRTSRSRVSTAEPPAAAAESDLPRYTYGCRTSDAPTGRLRTPRQHGKRCRPNYVRP